MKRKGISQEALKLIACLTMLVDHIAAAMAMDYDLYMRMGPQLYLVLRGIGRVAFPIYCFLMAEGAHHTRSPGRYALRLLVGAVLSEIPFDLALFGGISWAHQSVMVTLLLGCLMMVGMDSFPGFWKLLAIPPFYGIAEFLGTDYGGNGILLIAMLALTWGLPREKLWRTLGFVVCLWFGPGVQIGTMDIPMELFGLIALIPMFLYDGKKLTRSKWVQWSFYLFYPAHLLILWLIDKLLIG